MRSGEKPKSIMRRTAIGTTSVVSAATSERHQRGDRPAAIAREIGHQRQQRPQLAARRRPWAALTGLAGGRRIEPRPSLADMKLMTAFPTRRLPDRADAAFQAHRGNCVPGRVSEAALPAPARAGGADGGTMP